MPRKHFRKLLPSHQSVKQNRYIAFFGTALHHHNLWHLHRRSVAGGVAAGLFCGLIPGPLQMLSAALLAIIFRVNLPVALVVTLYTNPLTIVPLYYVAYQLGALVTGQRAGPMPGGPLELTLSNFGQWVPLLVNWIGEMGRPFAIGLVLLASLLAVTGYLAVLGIWRAYVTTAWHRRAQARARARGRRP